MKSIVTKSANETQSLARKIASTLSSEDVLGLVGELGAGKTCFIQGLADGLGISDDYYVSSPTFTIMKLYKGPVDLIHFDFYRLSDADEFEFLGFDDYLKSGVVVIEWADKFWGLLPDGVIKIQFEVVDTEERKITISDELAKKIDLK